MKLPFQSSPAAGLTKAMLALVTVEREIAALAEERATALLEAGDDVEPIRIIDGRLAEKQKAAAIWRDRIAAFQVAIKEQRAVESERAHAAAVAVVQKRGAEEVELAEQVERDMRAFAASWNKLIGWRSRMIRDWPPGLPLPPADAFVDLRDLLREAGMLYYGLGNPTAFRQSSLPRAVAPTGVRGLEPVGLGNYVAGAVAAFVARLRNTRVPATDDQEAA